MIAFTYYIFKVILVSGLLYGYYLIALRNKKFHQYNRFYLILTVLLSLILPIIKISVWTTREAKVVKMLSAINYTEVYVKTIAEKKHFLSDYNQLALYSFLFITAIGFLIVTFRLTETILLIRDNPKEIRNNIYFVFLKNPGCPSSFFKYIFWDKNINPDSEEGNLILQHELIHVKHFHSLDKLLMNLVLAGAWANPFFWVIQKELSMLHEFIADKKAISNSDSNAFATMLLTAAYPQHSFVFNNSFFHSPIKRRLIMITTSKTTRFSYLRRLTVLPLMAIICIMLSFKIERKNNVEAGSFKENPESKSSVIENVSDTVEAKFPGGNDAWRKYLETNLDANVPVVKDKAPKGIYTVKVQFVVTETGVVRDVSATKTPDKCPSCAVEAVRIVKSGPHWEPMTIDGKKVASQPIQFISFMVQ